MFALIFPYHFKYSTIKEVEQRIIPFILSKSQYLLPVKCSIKKRKLQSIEDVSPLHRLQVKWLLQYATEIPQFMIELIISYFYKNVLNKILAPLKLSAGATELT